jgi:hypothetical protein
MIWPPKPTYIVRTVPGPSTGNDTDRMQDNHGNWWVYDQGSVSTGTAVTQRAWIDGRGYLHPKT